jgi:cytoskeleton protein RodZ
VRSFLRTYAEALDLDAKLLLEEYKLRHERPSDHDLMPIGAPRRRGRGGGGGGGSFASGGGGRHREPRRIPPGLVIGVIVLLLFAALFALGGGFGRGEDDPGGGDDAAQTTTGRTTTTRVPASTTSTTGSSAKRKTTKKASKLVRMQVVATGPGPVFACLVDAGGQARINGVSLQEGQNGGPYRSRSFRLRLGNGNARLRIDGKVRDVPDASPVAFRITKGSVKQVDPAQVPSCG